MINLEAERRNRGLSQDEMAAKVGVTRRVWGAAENGSQPRGKNARKIARFFGVEVTAIWPVDERVAA